VGMPSWSRIGRKRRGPDVTARDAPGDAPVLDGTAGLDEDRRVMAKVLVIAVVTLAVAIGLVLYLNRGPNLAACEAALRATYSQNIGNPSAPPAAPPAACSRVPVNELARIKTKVIGGQ